MSWSVEVCRFLGDKDALLILLLLLLLFEVCKNISTYEKRLLCDGLLLFMVVVGEICWRGMLFIALLFILFVVLLFGVVLFVLLIVVLLFVVVFLRSLSLMSLSELEIFIPSSPAPLTGGCAGGGSGDAGT